MSTLKVIVGLGNPGSSYQFTRHNAGSLLLQDFAKIYHFPEFKLEKKFNALVSRNFFQNQEVVLLLPQTFMNLSGESVRAFLNFYHIDPQINLLVAYDDLDLPFGKFKFGLTSPHGHNGLSSLQACLSTTSFSQIRLGIDDREGNRIIPSADYVLQNFSHYQLTTLSQTVFPVAREEILSWL